MASAFSMQSNLPVTGGSNVYWLPYEVQSLDSAYSAVPSHAVLRPVPSLTYPCRPTLLAHAFPQKLPRSPR